MMRRIWVSLIACGGLATAAGLPTADEVLNRYVEAIGGKAAHQRIRTIHSVATIDFRGTGRKATRTVYRAAPDRMSSVVEMEGVGRMEEGTDGKVAWSKTPNQGLRVKTGEEREVALRAAAWNGEVRLRELYPKIELTGAEPVKGHMCYKLLFTPASGQPMTRYFDAESGLLVRAVMKVNTPGGEKEVETDVDDFRATNGVKTPYRITQSGAGPLMVITIDKLEYNTEIPASRFELPAELRQMFK